MRNDGGRGGPRQATGPNRLAWACAVLVLLLAGCTVPGTEPSEPVPRLGWCPSWAVGPSTDGHAVSLNASHPSELAELAPPQANLTVRNGTGWFLDGHPLDLYSVTLAKMAGNAHAELVATDSANATRWIRDDRGVNATLKAFVVVDRTALERAFFVPLGSPLHADRPQPAPVRLTWRLANETTDGQPAHAELEYRIGYAYRVCGLLP